MHKQSLKLEIEYKLYSKIYFFLLAVSDQSCLFLPKASKLGRPQANELKSFTGRMISVIKERASSCKYVFSFNNLIELYLHKSNVTQTRLPRKWIP